MPSKTGSAPGRLPFDIDDVRAILGGVTEPKLLTERDRKGLSPIAFAALKSAAASDALLSLLDEKPKDDRADPVAEIQEMLLALAANLTRIERKLDRLTAALGAHAS